MMPRGAPRLAALHLPASRTRRMVVVPRQRLHYLRVRGAPRRLRADVAALRALPRAALVGELHVEERILVHHLRESRQGRRSVHK